MPQCIVKTGTESKITQIIGDAILESSNFNSSKSTGFAACVQFLYTTPDTEKL